MRLRWHEVTARSWEGIDGEGKVRASVIRTDYPPAWVAYVRPGGSHPIERLPADWPTRRAATVAAEAALDARSG
jgi:hypothetical protein